MSYVDIIIIALVILSALIGLWRGVGKALIKLVCFAAAVLVCFFVSDYCLKFLLGVDVIKQIALGESMSIRSLIGSAIEVDSTGIITKLYTPLLARYAEMGGAAQWGATNEQFLSVAMSLHMFTVLMTVILYFAAKIVMSIIGYALKIIFVHGAPGLGSRLGGMCIGAVKGVATVMLLLFVISVIFPFSFAQPVNAELEKSKIAPVICETEYRVLSQRLYSDETIAMMMNGAGFVKASSSEAQI